LTKQTTDYIEAVEVHVKYGEHWLVSARKEKVRSDHVGHAINLLSSQLQDSVEKLFRGEIKESDLIQTESHGEKVGMYMPDKDSEEGGE
jgi:uncharacterized protein (DUF1786 family)